MARAAPASSGTGFESLSTTGSERRVFREGGMVQRYHPPFRAREVLGEMDRMSVTKCMTAEEIEGAFKRGAGQ